MKSAKTLQKQVDILTKSKRKLETILDDKNKQLAKTIKIKEIVSQLHEKRKELNKLRREVYDLQKEFEKNLI